MLERMRHRRIFGLSGYTYAPTTPLTIAAIYSMCCENYRAKTSDLRRNQCMMRTKHVSTLRYDSEIYDILET